MARIVRSISLAFAALFALGALSSATAQAEAIVRASTLTANRLRARTIHVKQLNAAAGRVGQVVIVDDDRWAAEGRGKAVIKARDLAVDVVYAREITVDLIDADVVFAHQAVVGPTRYGK